MKLNELKSILYSNRGYTQFAILYDSETNADIATGTIDRIVADYGEKAVIRIEAFENQLIITV
jgi:hypothetical protein